jgi:hypothetical protein
MAERRHKRNSTFKYQQLLNPLFATESNTQDNLQKSVYKLNPTITEQ